MDLKSVMNQLRHVATLRRPDHCEYWKVSIVTTSEQVAYSAWIDYFSNGCLNLIGRCFVGLDEQGNIIVEPQYFSMIVKNTDLVR